MRIYLRLLKFIKPYRLRLVLAVLCMVVFAVTNGTLAYLVGPSIMILFAPGGQDVVKFEPLNMSVAREDLIFYIPFSIIIISIINGMASYGNIYHMGYVSQRMIADLRNKLYEHMMRLPLGYFTRTSTGKISSKLMHNVTFLSRTATDIVAIPKEIFSIVVLVGVVVAMDWKLALVALVTFPLAVYPAIKLSRKMKNLSRKGMDSMGNLTSFVHQAASGIRIVKAFCMEGYEASRFRKENERLTRQAVKTVRIRGLSPAIMQTVGAIGFALTIWYAAYRINSGTLTPEAFLSFFAAILMLYRSTKPLSGMQFNIQQGIVAATSVFKVMDIAEEPVLKPGEKTLGALNETVEFRGVCFNYGEKSVLNDINLVVRKRERVALVGASGAGKTTFVNLLPRFYDVTKGAILIDGTDIREFTLETLRRQISIVSQDVILFDDTIKSNIAYGDGKRTFEEIKRAAELANADNFISKLPNGYDTVIGEAGARLSGGERQRLSIARAILKDAPILILDEATSSLDSESEHKIQAALDNLMKDRTTFVIAHRLATVKNADRIVVLSNGKIVEIGRHEELLSLGGEYARFYS
ncbi:MAG: ABC transporter transmembrane domain-containing protein, partial [Thermodesulfobacteriota bacterium]